MEKKMKKCPYCGEEILAEAKKCKHCGEWLVETQQEDSDTGCGCRIGCACVLVILIIGIWLLSPAIQSLLSGLGIPTAGITNFVLYLLVGLLLGVIFWWE